jgi:hypothetical protein
MMEFVAIRPEAGAGVKVPNESSAAALTCREPAAAVGGRQRMHTAPLVNASLAASSDQTKASPFDVFAFECRCLFTDRKASVHRVCRSCWDQACRNNPTNMGSTRVVGNIQEGAGSNRAAANNKAVEHQTRRTGRPNPNRRRASPNRRHAHRRHAHRRHAHRRHATEPVRRPQVLPR